MPEDVDLSLKADQWNHLASLYTKKFGATGDPAQKALLKSADALSPFSEATAILDNGCGPAPLMTRLLSEYQIPDSCSLTCADFSEGMVKEVKKTKDEKVEADPKSAWERVTIHQNDAMDLKDVSDGSQSHVTAGFVYFMVADPQKALSESKRVLKEGGVLSCSAWQGTQWIDVMRVITDINPDSKVPQMLPEWSNADLLKGELDKAGFRDTEVKSVGAEMKFETRESIVAFFLKGMPHMAALTKGWSDEDVNKLKRRMEDELKKICPEEPGSMHGVALVGVGRK